MSKWNAEHQKGIEPTFLTRREGWGSEKTIFINEGGGGKIQEETGPGNGRPNPFFSPLLLRKRAHREKESDNFT